MSSIFSRGDECCYTTLLRNARNASRYEFLKDTQIEKALNNLNSVRVHLCKSLRSRKPFVLAMSLSFRMHSRHHCLFNCNNQNNKAKH